MKVNWTISQLDCLPTSDLGPDAVVTAHWRCTGEDKGVSGTVYGTCSFAVVEGEGFVRYPDLTLNTVLGWCYANGVDKDGCEDAVAQQIAAQKNPPIIYPPLPWNAAK